MKYHVSFNLNLIKNPYRGLYITFEGIDGSGKTTQVKKLGEYFRKKGKEVLIVKEPTTHGVIARLIHKALQSKIKIEPAALQYLFAADRTIHQQEVIIPSLKKGKIIISDRSFWSAIPYGLSDEDNPKIELAAQGILSMYDRFILPDLTFYLDVSPDMAYKRLSGRHKTKEIYEKKEKLKKISEGYKWLIDTFRQEIIIIDGEKSVDDVTNVIRYNIKAYEK